MATPLGEKRARLAPAGVLLAFAASAVVATTRLGAWVDEGYSLATSDGSPGLAAWRSLTVELQPPLYFVVLSLWRALGDSLFVARLLSVLLAAGTAWAVARAVTAADGARPAWVEPLVMLLVLANPFTFGYATEARGYALQMLLGALTALALCHVVRDGRASPRQVAALGAVGVLALYTHYYAALTTAAAAGVLWLTRRLKLTSLLAVAAVMIAAAVPLFAYMGPHVQHVNTAQALVPGESALLVLSALLLNGIPALTRHLGAQLAWVSVLAGLLAVSWATRGPAETAPVRGAKVLALTIAAVAGVLWALGTVVGPTALFQRYFAGVYPLAWVAVVLSLAASVGWARAGVVLAAVVALAALRTTKIQRQAHKSGDWRPMAKSLLARPGPTHIVYTYPLEEALPARLELPKPFRVLGFPRDFDGTRPPVPADFVLGTPAALAKRVQQSTGSAPFWLAIATPPLVPAFAEGDLPGIHRFVSECTTRKEERVFDDATLVLLTLRDECLR